MIACRRHSDEHYPTWREARAELTLVFGLTDDSEFCDDLARLYMGKYLGDKYRCMVVN